MASGIDEVFETVVGTREVFFVLFCFVFWKEVEGARERQGIID